VCSLFLRAQVDALAERMFSGSKLWEQKKAADRAAEAKKAAAAAAAAHH